RAAGAAVAGPAELDRRGVDARGGGARRSGRARSLLRVRFIVRRKARSLRSVPRDGTAAYTVPAGMEFRAAHGAMERPPRGRARGISDVGSARGKPRRHTADG